jgi:UDP-glucuronate decarboxylase
MIIALTGSKSQLAWKPLPVGDPKRRCPDITRAIQLSGWLPQVKLEEGLNATIGYFRGRGLRRSSKPLCPRGTFCGDP